MIKGKQSFVEMFAIFERSPDFICFASRDGYFIKVNDAVEHTLGYSKAELYSQPITSFIHPDDLSLTQSTRSAMLQGETLKNFQNRYLTKDNKVVWLEWTSIFLPDKEMVLAIAKNITVRKLVEIEVEEKYHRFKGLTSHFKHSMEKDRKYIAYELHEEIAQMTAALKMELETISILTPGIDETVKLQIQNAASTAELLLKNIKRISFSVRPALLDEFGLNAALEWLCKEFYAINKIPCSFSGVYDETKLSNEVKIDFFRICQKALTNVSQHAMAKQATITIIEDKKTICLCIIDDGIGFDTRKVVNKGGLIRMQGLVASINGKINVESEPGAGSRITVFIEK